MKNWLLHSLSLALNNLLKLDPESKQRLNKLQGKIISIELLPFHLVFYCEFNETGAVIETTVCKTPDTTITGTPFQMLNVAFIRSNRQQFFAEDVSITGDVNVAQDVISLFDALHIDWEEYLSQVVGDIPAYHAGRFASRVKEWFSKTNDSLSADINDYLHEEKQWLPTHEALQDFFSDIDELRMDVDRLSLRLATLMQEEEPS